MLEEPTKLIEFSRTNENGVTFKGKDVGSGSPFGSKIASRPPDPSISKSSGSS